MQNETGQMIVVSRVTGEMDSDGIPSVTHRGQIVGHDGHEPVTITHLVGDVVTVTTGHVWCGAPHSGELMGQDVVSGSVVAVQLNYLGEAAGYYPSYTVLGNDGKLYRRPRLQ